MRETARGIIEQIIFVLINANNLGEVGRYRNETKIRY